VKVLAWRALFLCLRDVQVVRGVCRVSIPVLPLKSNESVQTVLSMMLRVLRAGYVWWRRQHCLAQPRALPKLRKVSRMRTTCDKYERDNLGNMYGVRQCSKYKASQNDIYL
jgi:hypothetical protein